MSEASFAIPGDCDGGDVQKTIPAQQFCRIRADPPVARDVALNMSSNWTPAAMRSGRPEDDRGGAWQHPAKRRSRNERRIAAGPRSKPRVRRGTDVERVPPPGAARSRRLRARRDERSELSGWRHSCEPTQ